MHRITQERVKELVSYDPVTGVFTNKVPRGNITTGSILGSTHSRGYLSITIDRTPILAHRLAWFYMTGTWPQKEIDHKDQVKTNNSWSNLREASRSQNLQNKFYPNSLGVKGVRKTKSGKYEVRINSKNYGTYGDLDLAEFIAQEVRESLHGEFANHG